MEYINKANFYQKACSLIKPNEKTILKKIYSCVVQ